MDYEKREYLYSKPDVTWLTETYEETVSDLSGYRQQMAKNANVRFCKWVGQSDDGRKNGDDAYPWPGASDIRFPLIDDLCNTEAAYLTEAERRSSMIGVPVEGGDTLRAKLVANFMKWMTRSQMTELPDEVELAANYWAEKGGLVVGTFWDRRSSEWAEKVDLQDIARSLMEQGMDPSVLMDPMFDEEFRQLLQSNYPDAGDAKIAKAITELRETGEAELPRKGLTVNRPCVRVFRKGEDIIYPKSAANIQRAPFVFRVEYKTPQEIQEYANDDGWDKRWATKVIDKCRGMDTTEWESYERSRDRFGVNFDEGDDDGLIKVVWCYQRLIKNGILGIYETIFCPEYTPREGPSVAKHGLCPYRLKGDYPFEDFCREKSSRQSLNSRGIPDNAGDFQKIGKAYLDGEIDRQSLAIDPPFEYVIGRQVPERGPGAMWPVSRRGEAGYGDVPKFDPASRDMREWLIDLTRNYVGLTTDQEHANEVRAKKQANINKWLRCWRNVYRKVFWLYQQYGDEVITFRVMGSNTVAPEEFHKNPGEDYDFYLDFDALSQEPELQQQKIKAAIELFSAADRNGRGDWDQLLQKGVEIIDPTWAESMIKPEEQATQDEVKQEREMLMQMFSGMDVDLPEQGVNTQLRKQVVNAFVQGTEEIPATDIQARLQNEEDPFKMRLEKHMKQLEFIDQQRENAQIGRLGTNPGNMNAR